MIVAWHAVPGTGAPNEPSRRVRCDRCGCADRFDDGPDVIAEKNNVLNICCAIFYLGDHSLHGKHLLVPTTFAVAKVVQLIKAGSSAWIHQTFPNLRNFAWQQGYGAFSVGISQVQETVHYIEQQLEHLRTRTFQEEYLTFLKKHGAHFDEKYLWD